MSTHLRIIATKRVVLTFMGLAVLAGLFLCAYISLTRTRDRNDRRFVDFIYAHLDEHCVFRHPQIKCEIFVKSVQAKKLHDVLIMRRAPDGKGFDFIGRATEAELSVDHGRRQVLVRMRNCDLLQQNGESAFVESLNFPVELPADLPVLKRPRKQ